MLGDGGFVLFVGREIPILRKDWASKGDGLDRLCGGGLEFAFERRELALQFSESGLSSLIFPIGLVFLVGEGVDLFRQRLPTLFERALFGFAGFWLRGLGRVRDGSGGRDRVAVAFVSNDLGDWRRRLDHLGFKRGVCVRLLDWSRVRFDDKAVCVGFGGGVFDG